MMSCTATARASTDTPDMLYNLEIRQYEPNGDYITGTGNDYGNVKIGEHLSVNLKERSDCQLVLVARGSGEAVSTLGSNSLSNVQGMTVGSSVINGINPSVAGSMNAMPYVLHLEHVKVAVVGGIPVIQSKEGNYDTRLLLKRFATRLTVNWEYSVSGYKLKQLLLQSIPLNYAVVDKPESDGTYPSLVSQFTTLEVEITDANSVKGSYSCWVPANVRGESAAATSDIQRTKANAPTGSAFLNFVAVNTTDTKKKLDYRVYVGSGASTDFNMYRNKDYIYEVNFNHVGIPTSDRRVTYIDPVPASESNTNLVSTANCFMVAPGGAFCFDPFAFQQNGTEITNSQMTSWYGTAGTGIKSVKLLWQTKENGDVGDPVMGIANSGDDHTNIVDIKRKDGGEVTISPVNNKGQCLIYCRVAANTSGGNGVIAAYDGENGTGNIVWSWHVWVTDYNPDAKGSNMILEPVDKRKLLFSYNKADALPIMDRNLGAMAGFVDDAPSTYVEMSKANGFHYQWGRKDPFPSSYTTKKIGIINNKNSTTPPNGMLNRYGADGITYVVNEGKESTIDMRGACQKPLVFYAASGRGPAWTSVASASFSGWDETNKPFWDPCPAGWRVASDMDLSPVCQNGNSLPNNSIKNYDTREKDGGYLLYFQQSGSGHSSYFRFTGYGRFFNTFEFIGDLCSIWTRSKSSGNYGSNAGWFQTGSLSSEKFQILGKYQSDAHPLRCIQEKE